MTNPVEPTVESPEAVAEPVSEVVDHDDTDTSKVTDFEAETKKWMKRSRDNYLKLKEAEPKLAEYQRMVDAAKTDDERKTEELARWQSEAERWRNTSVASRIETLATGSFADPSDAVGALAEPGKYIDANGVINDAAIRKDLAEVLTRKPHWSNGSTGSPASTVPRAPWPNPAQGASGTGLAAIAGQGQTPADQFASLINAQLKR